MKHSARKFTLECLQSQQKQAIHAVVRLFRKETLSKANFSPTIF